MANQVWVRDYLKNLGAADEDIDYKNGAVTLKNKPFFYTNPAEDSKAYGTQSDLDAAYRAYQGNQMSNQMQTNYGNRQNQTNDLLNRYTAAVTKKPKAFSYNAESIKADPLYTSALASYTADANRGTNQALVNLGRRGIGNSQSAVTAELAGQKSINDYANTKLAPQIIAQKYQQYLDANAQQDKQNQGLLGLATTFNNLGQQEFNNNRLLEGDARLREQDRMKQEEAVALAAEKRRQQNIKDAMDLSEAYGVGVLPKESGEALFGQVEGLPTIKAQTEQRQQQAEQRQYFQELVNASDKIGQVLPELAEIIGVRPGTNMISAIKEINDAAYQMGMLKVSQQNAATSARNADTSALRAQTGVDREDRLSNPALKPEKKQSYKENPEYAAELEYVYSNPKGAVSEIQQNVKELTAAYGTDGYNALLSEARRVEKAANP